MMVITERESHALVCDKCLDDWSPKHAQHGQPIDEAAMVQRWREEIDIDE